MNHTTMSRRGDLAVLVAGLIGLGAVASPAAAQERYLDGDPDRPLAIKPSTAVAFTSVENVELMSPRQDGPRALVMFLKKAKLHPAPGTYRTRDGKALRVNEYGQIVELAGGEMKTGRLRVASIDEVAVRGNWDRPRIVLRDTRKRTVALPDGRYVNEDEVVIAVRNATIVGYGVDR